MKCSRLRSTVRRPFVENLESRLQPGSMITGSGYGWSLLADNLLQLNAGSTHSSSLVSQSSSESVRPTQTSAPVGVDSNHQDLAVVGVTVSSGSIPTSNLVDKVAASLSNDDLGLLTLTGRQNAVPVAPAQQPSAHPLKPTPVAAGFVESPILGLLFTAPVTLISCLRETEN